MCILSLAILPSASIEIQPALEPATLCSATDWQAKLYSPKPLLLKGHN